MSDIYDKIVANCASTISNASDREVSLIEFNEKVLNVSKIKLPKLNLEQTKAEIKNEEITYKNAPPGISFSMSGSRSIEYAVYSIPLSGDINLFISIAKPFIDRTRAYVEYNTLYYKEYSEVKISGNEDLINSIKNRVVSFTTNINNSLSQFDQEVNQFYETILKPKIDELIKSEIAKRNLKSDSESKLNPFA